MNGLSELDVYARLPVRVRSAFGAELVLADGARVLDLYGGHCVNTLGAGDAGIFSELDRQWAELSFATNLFDHDARDRFLEAFGANAPNGAWRVFLSNSGAEANENALKAGFAATGRERVVVFDGAFHGRTPGTAAASDTKNTGFPRAPFDVVRLPFDDPERASQAIDATVALVLLEPIQSLAGVVAASPSFLTALRAACDTHGALLAFDEVQTGNGRLGTPWASQAFGVTPDLFTTAKGAAGGLPIGITVVAEHVALRLPRGLFGSTFGGGPTVLAAATEVARRIAGPGFLDNVHVTSAALRAAATRAPVRVVRGTGLLLGLELEGWTASAARDRLFARGVLAGTSNDPAVVRLTPPLTLTPADASRLQSALEDLETTP